MPEVLRRLFVVSLLLTLSAVYHLSLKSCGVFVVLGLLPAYLPFAVLASQSLGKTMAF